MFDRKRSFVSFGSLLIVIGCWLCLIWLWEPGYLTLVFDDSFYYIKTAANLAAGFGFSFDRVTMTNGFHPLWMLVLGVVGLATGDSLIVMTRMALTLQVGLVSIGLFFLHRHNVLDLKKNGVLVALLIGNYYSTRILINGLESALQFCLLAIVITCWHRLQTQSWTMKSMMRFGLLSGVVTLARLETGLLVVTIFWMLMLQKALENGGIKWLWLRSIGAGLLIYGGVILPYVLWNLIIFGHLLPVSAGLKQRAHPAVFLAFLVCIGILGFVAVRVRVWLNGRYAFENRLWGIMPFIIYCVLLTGFYFTHGFYLWYLVPFVLGACIVVGWFSRVPLRLLIGIVLAGSALVTWYRLGINPERFAPELAMRDTGLWLQENTPPDALIAGWDVGIISAHSERRLINLDGLINSWEYKEKYLDTGDLETYIREVQPVDFVVQRVFVTSENERGTIEGVDLSDWTLVYIRYLNTPSSVIRRNRQQLNLAYVVLGKERVEGRPLFGDYRFELSNENIEP